MSNKTMSYILIAATIALTVAGQLLVKAGMLEVGPLPASLSDLWSFVLHVLTNLKVVAGLGLAVVAALCWTGAVSTSEISFAYPFMALAIVLVLALSGVLLGEVVPIGRWVGVAIVCIGLIVAARA
jgi:drug/metabolite transporter (DMT)-like permease